MDLNKIKYFQVVAEFGSISKACSVVHLSQPALSLQIQALEHELGMKLFERHNRGLLLTEEGKMLKERALVLKDWITDTQELLEQSKAASGLIKIGTYTTASSYLLAPILKGFFKNYPKIELEYDYSSTNEIIDKVKNLELDCAIISEAPDDPGITSSPFYKNELLLLAANKRKIPKSIKLEEISNYPFLSYPLKYDYCYREVDRKVGKYLRQCSIPIISESFDTLKQSLIHDLGITFMPQYLIDKELKKKQVKIINLPGLKLPITFSFITKKGRNLPHRIEVFKNFLNP